MTEPTKDAVAIRAPDGTIGTVPKEQLAEALDAGAQIVSPEAFAAAQQQVKFGGAAGQAQAAVEGVARGATFGLSDAFLTAGPESAEAFSQGASPDDIRVQMAARREVNPYASGAGEIVGAAAPVLLSGGEAAPAAVEGLSLGRAVRGLGALPRGVAALGGAAERGAAGLVGEGAGALGSRVVQRAIATGAAGATEGAFYGGGQAITESALGDHELTAEQLFAGAKGGALAGGLLAGATGGIGGVFSRRAAPAARDIEAVASRHLGDATPGLGELVTSASKFDSAADTYIARAADTPEQAKLLSEAWRRRAELFGNHEELLEQSTRKITENLDAAVKAERVVDMASFGEAKEGQMARLVDSTKWREARDAGLSVWQDAKNVVEELMADPTRGGSGVAVKRASNWLEKFGNELGEVATSKNKTAVAKEIFGRLDEFKRAMGQGAMYGKGPFGLPEAAREFDSLYHRIRGVLENGEVWGKAADAQREINAATQARLATRRQFGSYFTTQYGSEAGRPTFVASPEGVASYVRNLTSAKNDLKHRAIEEYISNEERFLSTVEKHYKLAPAQREQIAKAREAFNGLRATVQSTSKEITTVNQLRRLQNEEQAGGLGGMVGLAADVATRPLKTLERLAAIEQQARRIDDTLRKGVRTIFVRPERPAVAAGETLPLGEEFKRVSTAVRRLTADGVGLAARIAHASGDMSDHAPQTAAHLSVVASRAATFLASKLPAGRTNPDSLTPHLEEPRISDAEKSKFLRYARAANDPTSVVHDVAAGRVSREGVEAMKTVYPRLYARTQEHIAEQLGRLKEPLAYQKEIQLKILLGKPVGDPAFGKAVDRALKDGADNDNAKGPSQTVPLKLSVDSRSESERVEGGGA